LIHFHPFLHSELKREEQRQVKKERVPTCQPP
jgi:hypothetical protein